MRISQFASVLCSLLVATVGVGSSKIDQIENAGKVFCTIHSDDDPGKECEILNQKIDSEIFTVATNLNIEVSAFSIQNNKEVKFLIENIAEMFPKLIVYRVEKCRVRLINQKHFENMRDLEILSLQTNEIDTIARDAFKYLIKLQGLKLSGNKIEVVDPGWFEALSSLQELSIGHNQIKNLDNITFNKLSNLNDLALGHNNLTALPETLFKHNLKLQQIYLYSNQLQSVSATMFDHLNKLDYVDLGDTCVNRFYLSDSFDVMRNDLRTNCSSII